MSQIQERFANSGQHKPHSRDSEPLLGPFLGIPNSKPRAIRDDPTNEDLGIVPYSGRVILLGYVLYIALVIGGLAWLL